MSKQSRGPPLSQPSSHQYTSLLHMCRDHDAVMKDVTGLSGIRISLELSVYQVRPIYKIAHLKSAAYHHGKDLSWVELFRWWSWGIVVASDQKAASDGSHGRAALWCR